MRVSIDDVMGLKEKPFEEKTPVDFALEFEAEQIKMMDLACALGSSGLITTEGVLSDIAKKVGSGIKWVLEKIKNAFLWILDKLKELQLWFSKKAAPINTIPTYLNAEAYMDFWTEYAYKLTPTFGVLQNAFALVGQNPKSDAAWEASAKFIDSAYNMAENIRLGILNKAGIIIDKNPRFFIKDRRHLDEIERKTKTVTIETLRYLKVLSKCIEEFPNVVNSLSEEYKVKYNAHVHELYRVANTFIQTSLTPALRITADVLFELKRAASGGKYSDSYGYRHKSTDLADEYLKKSVPEMSADYDRFQAAIVEIGAKEKLTDEELEKRVAELQTKYYSTGELK